jgi:catechol 2,3-dioxygenase-like lactoylglutathione lyase family enzyme
MDHLNLNVKDLEESVAFYKNLFGFELKKDQPEQQSQIIGNEMIKLCLYQNPGAVSQGEFNHFGFHVENFDEIEERCKALGVRLLYGGVQWEQSRSFYIKDPNGYEIELSELNGGGL